MTDLMIEVLSKLRQLYPEYEVVIWEKSDRAKLFVNGHMTVKFNLELQEKLLNARGKESVNDTVKFLAQFIETRYVSRKHLFVGSHWAPQHDLTESQIIYAIQNSKSISGAARFLSVCRTTFKKYAEMYGLYKQYPHFNRKGISHNRGVRVAKMEDILSGKHPNYSVHVFKERLINELILEEKCEICGFNEKRKDGACALMLDFVDGNSKNKKRENIRLLCYNHIFIFYGRQRLSFVKKLSEKLEDGALLTEGEYLKKQEQLFEKFNKKQE